MKNKKQKFYNIKLTAEHLRIIQNSVEIVSRAKSGQFDMLVDSVLAEYEDSIYLKHYYEIKMLIVEKIQKSFEKISFVGMKNKAFYQLYRDILHFWNKGDSKLNVYATDRKVTELPYIEITEIQDEKNTEYIEGLEYHRTTTEGLFAIDRDPREVDYTWILKNSFKIKFARVKKKRR